VKPKHKTTAQLDAQALALAAARGTRELRLAAERVSREQAERHPEPPRDLEEHRKSLDSAGKV
jgi:hypothetical protein